VTDPLLLDDNELPAKIGLRTQNSHDVLSYETRNGRQTQEHDSTVCREAPDEREFTEIAGNSRSRASAWS
jgi:hypothetical protein